MIITFEFFFDWANSKFLYKGYFHEFACFWALCLVLNTWHAYENDNQVHTCCKAYFFWHSKFQFVWNSKILMSQLPDIRSHFVSPYLDFETPAWRLETASSDSRNDWVCSHWCSLSVVHRKLFGIRAPCKSLWYVLSAVSTFSFLLFAFFCSLAQYPHSYLIYLNLLSQSLEVIVV